MKTIYNKLKLPDLLKPLAFLVILLMLGYNARSQSSNSPVCEGSSDILLSCSGGVITTCDDIGVPGYPRYSWICTATGFTSTQKNPIIPIGDPYYHEGTYYLTVWYGPGPNDFQNGFTTVVFIDPLVPGTAGNNQTICPGEIPANDLTCTTFAGGAGINNITYTWEKRVPPATTWTPTTITGVGPFPLYLVPDYTFPEGPITETTEYRVKGVNTFCSDYDPEYSNIVTITVRDVPGAGTITPPQTICYGDVPAGLTGSDEGVGVTYKWEYNVPPSGSWVEIPGETGKDLAFTDPLYNSTNYHRWTIAGTCISPDPTDPLLITVQSVPTAGEIAENQTICNGVTPEPLTNLMAGTGDGTISYKWFSKPAGGSWGEIVGETGEGLTFTAGLTVTTEFERQTVSTLGTSVCLSDEYSNVVTIIVQPVLEACTISPAQTICYATVPENLVADCPEIPGYTYFWESSIDGVEWIEAEPVQSGAEFNFGTTMLEETTTYRRTVISIIGTDTCYSPLSNEVTITVQMIPVAGDIAANQTICTGFTPDPITTGTIPPEGSGELSFVWYSSTDGINWGIIPDETAEIYAPGALMETTYYHRTTVSTLGTSVCETEEMTNDVQIYVMDAPIAEVEGDTLLCHGGCGYYYALGGAPGDTYEWSVSGTYYSIDYFGDYVYVCWASDCSVGQIQVTISRGNCTSTSDPLIVNFKPEPTNPAIHGPLTVLSNNTANYIVMNGDPAHQYNWSVENGTIVDGQGTEMITVLWDVPCAGCEGRVCVTEYDPENSECGYGYDCLDNIEILHADGTNVFGTLVYDNDYLTPLNGVEIELLSYPDLNLVGECLTGPNMLTGEPGFFGFVNIPDGDYILHAHAYGNWGGNNATDALIVQMNTGGTWAPLYAMAADVNASYTINATDALNIKLRVVDLVDHYAAGDWAFWHLPFTLDADGGHIMDFGNTFRALCVGDVNASYIPTMEGYGYPTKSASQIVTVAEGTTTVPAGQTFTYDLMTNSVADLGAMTLFMTFDNNLFEIEGVTSALDGLQYKVNNGKVAIAWSDAQTVSTGNNETLATFTVKTLKPIDNPTQIFTINEGSEFANGNAKVINFNLKMANVITGSQTFSIVNYPNPFTNTTTITYTLPEAGQVRLVLTDMFGKTITVLEDAYKTSGTYSIQVNPASFSLSQGVYLYKIDVNGASDTYSKINKMIFQK